MIAAIVPAAGKSSRMGQPKLLLPLGNRRVIEHVLRALAESKVDQTIVVVSADNCPLLDVVAHFPVSIARLDSPTPDMRGSVLAGLDALSATGRDTLDAFLVAPADQPTIQAQTIDALIDRFRDCRAAVCVPVFAGRRGHPVLFDAQLIGAARRLGPGDGLNRLLADHAAEVSECAVDSPSVLDDLDTPADYDRMRSRNVHGV